MKAANVGYLHGVEEELASAAVDEETTFQVVDTHNSSLSRHSAYIILGYLSIGCAFFSWSEGWPWDDALYYCVVTMTTTGYGDLVPTSNASKLFAVTYIIFGVPQTPPPQPQTLRSQIALLSTDTASSDCDSCASPLLLVAQASRLGRRRSGWSWRASKRASTKTF